MSLLVDDRIGSREFLRPLKQMGLPVRQTRLRFADFAFSGNGPDGERVRVGIERKRVAEVLTAVMDSRFIGHQLPGLLTRYRYVFLVVEGYTTVDKLSGLLMQGKWEAGFGRGRHLYETFTKAKLTWAIKARLLIIPTMSFAETTHFIHAAYRWFDAPWKSHKAAYKVEETLPDRAILDNRTLFRKLAAQMPGVGWERSRQVCAYFGSPAAMVNATVPEWQRALGIKEGVTVASTLVAFCKGDAAAMAKTKAVR